MVSTAQKLPVRLATGLALIASLLLKGCEEIFSSLDSSPPPLRSITTVPGDACGWEPFLMNGTQYLALALCDADAPSESVIYKWDGARLSDVQHLPTRAAGDIEHVEVGATPYLAVANREGNESTLYQWDGSRFAEYQTFATRWGSDWEDFVIDGTTFLAGTSFHDGGQVGVYAWNGTSFEVIQTISTKNEPRGLSYFEVDGQKILAIACHEGGGVAIHKWSGSNFALSQELAAEWAVDLEHFRINDVLYLAVAEHRKEATRIYAWSGADFQEFQSLPAAWTLRVHAFVAGGVNYLALGSSSQAGDRNSFYAWTGSSFELKFREQGGTAVGWTSFRNATSGQLFLAVARLKGSSELFEFDETLAGS